MLFITGSSDVNKRRFQAFFYLGVSLRVQLKHLTEMMISWHQKGKSLKEIADLTGRSLATVQTIIKKWKDAGCIENQWHKGRISKFTTFDANRLRVV